MDCGTVHKQELLKNSIPSSSLQKQDFGNTWDIEKRLNIRFAGGFFLNKVLVGQYKLRLWKSGVSVAFYSVTDTDQFFFSFWTVTPELLC